jgi:hypothetical protein
VQNDRKILEQELKTQDNRGGTTGNNVAGKKHILHTAAWDDRKTEQKRSTSAHRAIEDDGPPPQKKSEKMR